MQALEREEEFDANDEAAMAAGSDAAEMQAVLQKLAAKRRVSHAPLSTGRQQLGTYAVASHKPCSSELWKLLPDKGTSP